MPALKVFSGIIAAPRDVPLGQPSHVQQCRALVITTSQAKAAKIAGTSVSDLRNYWGGGERLGHRYPGLAWDTLYVQPLDLPTAPWVKVDR